MDPRSPDESLGCIPSPATPIQPVVSIQIRPAGVADASRVADLARDLGYPVAEGRVREAIVLLRGDDHALFVATLPKEGVIAWVETRREETLTSGRRCRVTGLVVSPSVRRTGV